MGSSQIGTVHLVHPAAHRFCHSSVGNQTNHDEMNFSAYCIDGKDCTNELRAQRYPDVVALSSRYLRYLDEWPGEANSAT